MRKGLPTVSVQKITVAATLNTRMQEQVTTTQTHTQKSSSRRLSQAGCSYVRVTCAKRNCSIIAIHPVVERPCPLLMHSQACHDNFCSTMLAHNLRSRLPALQQISYLESERLAKSGDRADPRTRNNMLVFCAFHTPMHDMLPGPAKGRDLECFVDFWKDFACGSLREGISDPRLGQGVAFNKCSRVEENADDADRNGEELCGLEVTRRHDVSPGKEEEGEEKEGEEEAIKDVVRPTLTPEKLSPAQFRGLFREYCDYLTWHKIVFLDPSKSLD